MTLGIDIGVIKMILTHAAAIQGLEIRVEGIDVARAALQRFGLIGKGLERDRRLTMPMTRIVEFAIATAMRLTEHITASTRPLRSTIWAES